MTLLFGRLPSFTVMYVWLIASITMHYNNYIILYNNRTTIITDNLLNVIKARQDIQ